jgi:hypothetical protein
MLGIRLLLNIHEGGTTFETTGPVEMESLLFLCHEHKIFIVALAIQQPSMKRNQQ